PPIRRFLEAMMDMEAMKLEIGILPRKQGGMDGQHGGVRTAAQAHCEFQRTLRAKLREDGPQRGQELGVAEACRQKPRGHGAIRTPLPNSGRKTSGAGGAARPVLRAFYRKPAAGRLPARDRADAPS